jgi:hypothetical protein
MLKAIFITNNEPLAIVSKYQSQPDSAESLNTVLKWVKISQDPALFKPIIHTENYNILLKKSGEVWIAAVIEGDAAPMLFASYIEKIESILHQFIENPLTEFGVKDNFVTVYRIIDVFLDSDFPLCDDFDSVIQFIPQKEKTEKAQFNAMYPWRATLPASGKSKITFDVTEYLDLSISSTGKIINNQIRGVVDISTVLDGSPRISFGFKNSPLFDDIAVHNCVDFKSYMATKRIEFVPPTGKCNLLKYRLQITPKVPIEVKTSFIPQTSKVDLKVSVSVNEMCDDVSIAFDVLGASDARLTETAGTHSMLGDRITWTLGKMKPGKAQELNGVVECGSFCRQTVFMINFQSEQSLSGFDIQNVNIGGVQSAPSTKINYTAKAGHFQIRNGMA